MSASGQQSFQDAIFVPSARDGAGNRGELSPLQDIKDYLQRSHGDISSDLLLFEMNASGELQIFPRDFFMVETACYDSDEAQLQVKIPVHPTLLPALKAAFNTTFCRRPDRSIPFWLPADDDKKSVLGYQVSLGVLHNLAKLNAEPESTSDPLSFVMTGEPANPGRHDDVLVRKVIFMEGKPSEVSTSPAAVDFTQQSQALTPPSILEIINAWPTVEVSHNSPLDLTVRLPTSEETKKFGSVELENTLVTIETSAALEDLFNPGYSKNVTLDVDTCTMLASAMKVSCQDWLPPVALSTCSVEALKRLTQTTDVGTPLSQEELTPSTDASGNASYTFNIGFSVTE